MASNIVPVGGRTLAASFAVATLFAGWASAQTLARNAVPVPPLGDGPFVFDTAEQHKIRVTVVTKGLVHPWSLAFTPDGSILVTERPGRLRIIRDGALSPTPVSGVPAVKAAGMAGLQDIALHPRFSENQLVYFTYIKPDEKGWGAPTVARGRLSGNSLADVSDLLVTDAREGNQSLSGRIAFGPDGLLYFAVGGYTPNHAEDPAQDTQSLRGKILRLRDDGSVPPDNPFLGKPGYRPEIYSLGHRNPEGLIFHPVTGALWNHEHGPSGGDELNVVLPGRNYGWPLVTYGREYVGTRITEHPTREGMESPAVVWLPSIAISGITFYTGDRFPRWKNNAFVGSLRIGNIPATGHLQRIVFNQKGEELRRESLLVEFKQRIRDVRQGPDGCLYVLTDENQGALLKIEPWQ